MFARIKRFFLHLSVNFTFKGNKKVNTLVIQSLVSKKEAVAICQPDSLKKWEKKSGYGNRKESAKTCDVKLPETSKKR